MDAAHISVSSGRVGQARTEGVILRRREAAVPKFVHHCGTFELRESVPDDAACFYTKTRGKPPDLHTGIRHRRPEARCTRTQISALS